MVKKKSKAGRPTVKDKVKVVSAYLRISDKNKIIKKYGSITKALMVEALPKCG